MSTVHENEDNINDINYLKIIVGTHNDQFSLKKEDDIILKEIENELDENSKFKQFSQSMENYSGESVQNSIRGDVSTEYHDNQQSRNRAENMNKDTELEENKQMNREQKKKLDDKEMSKSSNYSNAEIKIRNDIQKEIENEIINSNNDLHEKNISLKKTMNTFQKGTHDKITINDADNDDTNDDSNNDEVLLYARAAAAAAEQLLHNKESSSSSRYNITTAMNDMNINSTMLKLEEKIDKTENALKEQIRINQELAKAIGTLGGGGDVQKKDEEIRNQSQEASAMESILRDRLGHFKLAQDTYNTHFYEVTQDYALAQKNMLKLPNLIQGVDIAKGDLLFYVGNRVRAARIGGYLVTGGVSAFWSRDDWSGNRLGELRVRADELTLSELAALFYKYLKDEDSSFTLNRVKDYVRETGLRVAEYSYCSPRNKAVPKGMFAVFLELEPVSGLTSHHGVKTIPSYSEQPSCPSNQTLSPPASSRDDTPSSLASKFKLPASTSSLDVDNVDDDNMDAEFNPPLSSRRSEPPLGNPFTDPYQTSEEFGV